MLFICLTGLGSTMQVRTQTQETDDWTLERDSEVSDVVAEHFRCCGFVYCTDKHGDLVRFKEEMFDVHFRPYDPSNPNVGPTGIPIVKKK